MPEREPADRLIMTTSASELKCRDEVLRGNTKEVKGVLRASFATDKTSGTEWSRTCVFEGAMRRRRDATVTGAETQPFIQAVWESNGGGNKTAPGCYGYRGVKLSPSRVLSLSVFEHLVNLYILFIYFVIYLLFYRVICQVFDLHRRELSTSQCEGVFTVVARDYEQAAKYGDFESFISAPTKTSQVRVEQRETSE
jgi:hypothetical protein